MRLQPSWSRAYALVALLLVLQLASEYLRPVLRLARPAVADGELWRLVTAHFMHLGWNHTLLNAAGVLLCCAFAPERFDRGLWWRLGALALGVGLCLWWLSPGVSGYVGLSGVLYGMLVLCLLPQALAGERIAWLALVGVFCWMMWQWLVAPAASEERFIGGNIVGIAHIYGFCLGLAGMGAGWCWRRWRGPAEGRSSVPR